jgi:hypothetical protein
MPPSKRFCCLLVGISVKTKGLGSAFKEEGLSNCTVFLRPEDTLYKILFSVAKIKC